ncbi:hypothetical protein M0P48_02080 [Candidatus Gracilibacteria bacterium]|nr:hypothetical protein [Candidatus Gracilibacteria bacterium]
MLQESSDTDLPETTSLEAGLPPTAKTAQPQMEKAPESLSIRERLLKAKAKLTTLSRTSPAKILQIVDYLLENGTEIIPENEIGRIMGEGKVSPQERLQILGITTITFQKNNISFRRSENGGIRIVAENPRHEKNPQEPKPQPTPPQPAQPAPQPEQQENDSFTRIIEEALASGRIYISDSSPQILPILRFLSETADKGKNTYLDERTITKKIEEITGEKYEKIASTLKSMNNILLFAGLQIDTKTDNKICSSREQSIKVQKYRLSKIPTKEIPRTPQEILAKMSNLKEGFTKTFLQELARSPNGISGERSREIEKNNKIKSPAREIMRMANNDLFRNMPIQITHDRKTHILNVVFRREITRPVQQQTQTTKLPYETPLLEDIDPNLKTNRGKADIQAINQIWKISRATQEEIQAALTSARSNPKVAENLTGNVTDKNGKPVNSMIRLLEEFSENGKVMESELQIGFPDLQKLRAACHNANSQPASIFNQHFLQIIVNGKQRDTAKREYSVASQRVQFRNQITQEKVITDIYTTAKQIKETPSLFANAPQFSAFIFSALSDFTMGATLEEFSAVTGLSEEEILKTVEYINTSVIPQNTDIEIHNRNGILILGTKHSIRERFKTIPLIDTPQTHQETVRWKSLIIELKERIANIDAIDVKIEEIPQEILPEPQEPIHTPETVEETAEPENIPDSEAPDPQITERLSKILQNPHTVGTRRKFIEALIKNSGEISIREIEDILPQTKVKYAAIKFMFNTKRPLIKYGVGLTLDKKKRTVKATIITESENQAQQEEDNIPETKNDQPQFYQRIKEALDSGNINFGPNTKTSAPEIILAMAQEFDRTKQPLSVDGISRITENKYNHVQIGNIIGARNKILHKFLAKCGIYLRSNRRRTNTNTVIEYSFTTTREKNETTNPVEIRQIFEKAQEEGRIKLEQDLLEVFEILIKTGNKAISASEIQEKLKNTSSQAIGRRINRLKQLLAKIGIEIIIEDEKIKSGLKTRRNLFKLRKICDLPHTEIEAKPDITLEIPGLEAKIVELTTKNTESQAKTALLEAQLADTQATLATFAKQLTETQEQLTEAQSQVTALTERAKQAEDLAQQAIAEERAKTTEVCNSASAANARATEAEQREQLAIARAQIAETALATAQAALAAKPKPIRPEDQSALTRLRILEREFNALSTANADLRAQIAGANERVAQARSLGFREAGPKIRKEITDEFETRLVERDSRIATLEKRERQLNAEKARLLSQTEDAILETNDLTAQLRAAKSLPPTEQDKTQLRETQTALATEKARADDLSGRLTKSQEIASRAETAETLFAATQGELAKMEGLETKLAAETERANILSKKLTKSQEIAYRVEAAEAESRLTTRLRIETETALASAQEQIAKLEKDLRVALKAKPAETSKPTKKNAELEAENERLRTQVQIANSKVVRMEQKGGIQAMRDQIVELKARVLDLTRQLEGNDNIITLQTKIGNLEETIAKERAKLKEKGERIEELEKQLKESGTADETDDGDTMSTEQRLEAEERLRALLARKPESKTPELTKLNNLILIIQNPETRFPPTEIYETILGELNQLIKENKFTTTGLTCFRGALSSVVQALSDNKKISNVFRTKQIEQNIKSIIKYISDILESKDPDFPPERRSGITRNIRKILGQ